MVGIRLYHGRKDPNQQMDDWGENGPVLGPFDGVHSTYLYHIRPVVDGECDGELEVFEDMYYYDGMYYGDMVVLSWDLAQKDHATELAEWDPEKAKMKK